MEGIFLELTLVLGSILETNKAIGSDAIGILSEKVLSGFILNFGISVKLAIFPLALYSISINIFDLFKRKLLKVNFFFNCFFYEGDFPF